MRELGKFHGKCYSLKENDPIRFREIIEDFKEPRFSHEPQETWNTILKASPKRGVNVVRNDENLRKIVPESFLLKVEKLTKDPWNYMKKKVQPKEPVAVICHGDYLRNNIAFQYNAGV